jgi:O-acetyl-ADP-ribose deacetylase
MMEHLRTAHLPTGQTIHLSRGDITQAPVDAIVNAANEQLVHAGGLAAAIVQRGGQVIQQQSADWLAQHGPVTHTRPAITSAGALPCRYILHAVGPIWGSGDEAGKLDQAVRGALRTADELNLDSLAMPAISTGIFGFPKEQAARVILGALAGYFQQAEHSGLRQIEVILYDAPTLEPFIQAFDRRWPKEAGGQP